MKIVFAAVLCLVFGYNSVYGAVTVEVSATDKAIQVGGTTDVACKILEYPGDGTLVTWYKKQSDDHVVQMGTNAELNDVFTNTGRYSAKRTQENGETSYVITISNAQAEDTGEIGCEIKSESVPKTYTAVEVFEEVKGIRLFGRLYEDSADVVEYHDGQTIEFFDGDRFYFRCEAAGNNTSPNIDITFDSNNVSDKFKRESVITRVDGQPGLKRVRYNVTMTTQHPVVINSAQNSRQFTCSARTGDTAAHSITITPRLSFRPQITCTKYTYYLPLLYTQLEVNCVVKSDPFPADEDIYLYWENRLGANWTLTSNSENMGHYRMYLRPGNNPDEKNVTFEVDRLFPQTFRKYTLYAINKEGTSSKEIVLTRDTSNDMDAGSYVTASISSLIMAVLAAMLLR